MSKISDYSKSVESARALKPPALDLNRGEFNKLKIEATECGSIRIYVGVSKCDLQLSDAQAIISWLKENCE